MAVKQQKSDKRARIIAAAEEVFISKREHEANISEIAKKAQIADSAIYQYFKSKEDLLFSIPEERMKEVLKSLEEHLQGIPDPESKLSKIIWFHLYYNDQHRAANSLVFFQCRSNAEFYKSKAYGLMRQYAGVVLGVLEEGVAKGVFRSDVNMRLVRDIIFGTVDLEHISCVALGEVEFVHEKHEAIYDLISRMIKKVPADSAVIKDKATRILLAAEKIFSQKGYGKATMSEIAGRAGVADGTVYEYFENKEDLLLSISERRFKTRLEQLGETFEIRSPLRKLRRLIRYYFSTFLMERDFLKVFLLHTQLNIKFYESKAFEYFRVFLKTIEDVIIEGVKDGSFRPEVDPRIFRNLFWGAISHAAIRWFVLDKRMETDIVWEIDHMADLLTRAVLPWEKGNGRANVI